MKNFKFSVFGPHDTFWEILGMILMIMGTMQISGALQQVLTFIPAGSLVAFLMGICIWILALAIRRTR